MNEPLENIEWNSSRSRFVFHATDGGEDRRSAEAIGRYKLIAF